MKLTERLNKIKAARQDKVAENRKAILAKIKAKKLAKPAENKPEPESEMAKRTASKKAEIMAKLKAKLQAKKVAASKTEAPKQAAPSIKERIEARKAENQKKEAILRRKAELRETLKRIIAEKMKAKLKTKAAEGDDFDEKSPEYLAETFVNGNIEHAKGIIGNDYRLYRETLDILQEMNPESVESFKRTIGGGFSKKSNLRPKIVTRKGINVKAQGETDEFGTPVVGEAPEEDENEAPKPEATHPETKPESPEEKPATENPAAETIGVSPEDIAKAIVTVNDKINEIEKQSEIDKAVKTELESIKQELTGVTAKLKNMKIKAEKVAPKKFAKSDIVAIAKFLETADNVYTKEMTGFENKASLNDKTGFNTITAGLRMEMDSALEKSKDVIVAYRDNKSDVDTVKESVRAVKSALDKWNVFKKTVAVFGTEAKYANYHREHIKKVISAVQEMVENEIISPAEFTSQAMEYMELNEKEFRNVLATINRAASANGVSPVSIPAVQTMSRTSELEDIFE